MKSYMNQKIVLFLILLQIGVVLIYIYLSLFVQHYDSALLFATISIVVIALFLFIISENSFICLRKQYFRISIVFIIGYLIVCFQKYVDLLLGYVGSYNSFLFVSPTLINRAALLSLSGLLSFLIGYLIYRPSIKTRGKVVKSTISIRGLKYILFLSVCLFIYYNGIDYILGSYSQEYLESKHGTIASYSEVIVRSLIYAILILHVKMENKFSGLFMYIKSFGWLFNLSLFMYLFLVLISGDRGPIIAIVSVWFFSYILKVRPKFSLLKIIVLFTIASITVTILGIARTMDNELSYNEKIELVLSDEKLMNDRSIINSTAELASSVRCLHHAIDYVPRKHPFLYGSFQFRDICSMIPASNSFLNIFMDDSFQYTSSAYFITYINQGKFYKYGDGSNVVADLYLSFGLLGVVVGLFLFGVFVKKIEVICFSYDCSQISLGYYALAFTYISFAVYMSRATIFMPLKYFSFTFIILCLNNLFTNCRNSIKK